MGQALDVVTTAGTAIGAALAATTVVAGDSLTVRNCGLDKRVLLLNAWADVQVAGSFRVRSPKMHDNVDGIRCETMIGIVEPVLPFGVGQRLYPQDTLLVDLAGSAVAGDVESISLLVYYEDLPGVAARFITPDELGKRGQNIIGIRNTVTTAAGPGYTGAEAINAEVDLMKNNTDYALVGYQCTVETCSICWRGADTGNLRVGGPGEPTLWHHTREWFIRLSRSYALPLIPVFNSGNRAGVLIDCAQDENAAAVPVTSFFVELAPR